MPRKKAAPDPAPEVENEFVSTAEPDAPVPAGMTEDAAPAPDNPAPVPEAPPADGPEAGEGIEPEAVDAAQPEILGLEPGPSPDIAETGGVSPTPDTSGNPVDISEREQAPFPASEQALDGSVLAADSISLPGESTADDSADIPAGAEVPDEESTGAADGESPEAAEHGVQDESAELEPAPRRRAAGASAEVSEASTTEAPRTNGPQPEPSDENPRHSFYDLDFNALDRDLSPKQRQEWNSIYASYRGRSVLTGSIAGVDRHSVRVRDRRTGEMVRQDMYCATVIPFRVRILIPSTEMWMQGEERPDYVLRNMSGAVIDFVVTHVNREADFAIASRRLALRTRRYYFSTQPSMNRSGARVKCHVLAVGPRRCLVECGGYDIDLTQREMRYTAIPDLREQYHRGDTLDCIVKNYDREGGKLVISVKETNPNPFDGAELRHPEGSRRQAEIAGKYAGGVFCNLPDGVVVMCSYSFHYDDAAFAIGDKVIVIIQRYDFNKKQIYGKIVAKW